MQDIILSLKIFDLKIVRAAFNAFNEVVKGKVSCVTDESVKITFFTDDKECIDEFCNYLIGLSAREA